MKGRFRITVDRDSVAMGDDMRSHKREITARPGARLSSLLATAAPEIHAAGWSWVAFADGEVVCVWSIDHGVQLLVRDRRTAPWNRPHEILFRYFRQIDPAWLHARLAEGALAIPDDLERAFAPIAAIRPLPQVEPFLVAALGAELRAARGLPRIPEHQHHDAPALRPMGESTRGTPRWSTEGDEVFQLCGEDAVACFEVSAGRTVAEVAALFGRDH